MTKRTIITFKNISLFWAINFSILAIYNHSSWHLSAASFLWLICITIVHALEVVD